MNAPARGSASVRVPAWRQLRTAVGSLLGWQVGVSLGSFRQDTFLEAARKAEALDLAVVEGDSTQKVSVQIPKNLDYRLAPGEMDAVRDRMTTLNLRMPVYFTPEISEDEQIARKQFEFAKSLGVETLAVERTPAVVAGDREACGRVRRQCRAEWQPQDCARDASRTRAANRGVCRSRQVDAGRDCASRWNCAAQRQVDGSQG